MTHKAIFITDRLLPYAIKTHPTEILISRLSQKES